MKDMLGPALERIHTHTHIDSQTKDKEEDNSYQPIKMIQIKTNGPRPPTTRTME